MADLVAWTVYGAIAVVVLTAVTTWFAEYRQRRDGISVQDADDVREAMVWMAAVREPAPQRRDAQGRFLPQER